MIKQILFRTLIGLLFTFSTFAYSQTSETEFSEKYIHLILGDTQSLHKMRKEGLPVDTTNEKGTSLLMLAAFNGDLSQMKSLIAAGADINQRNKKNMLMMYNSPLDYAAYGNQKQAVDLLLAQGVDINQKDPSGMSPVYKCGLYKNYKMLYYLVEKGAILTDEDRINIMVMAAQGVFLDEQSTQIIKYILQDIHVEREELMKCKLLATKGLPSSYNKPDQICDRIISLQNTYAEALMQKKAEQREQDSLKNLLATGQADTIRYTYNTYSSIDLSDKTVTSKIKATPRVDSVKNKVGHKTAGIICLLLAITLLLVYNFSKLMDKYVIKGKTNLFIHIFRYIIGCLIIYPILACMYANLDDILVRKYGEEKVATLSGEWKSIKHSGRYNYTTWYIAYSFHFLREDGVRISVNQGNAKFNNEYGDTKKYMDIYGDTEQDIKVNVRYDSAAQKLSVDDNTYFLQNLNWIFAMGLILLVILLFCCGKFNKLLDKVKSIIEKNAGKNNKKETIIEMPCLVSTCWTFTSQKYESLEAFVYDVRNSEKQKNLKPEECMNPDNLIILEQSAISINLFDNDVKGNNNLNIKIIPYNKKDITEGELMFQLHNQMIPYLNKLNVYTLECIILFSEDKEKKQAECFLLMHE